MPFLDALTLLSVSRAVNEPNKKLIGLDPYMDILNQDSYSYPFIYPCMG